MCIAAFFYGALYSCSTFPNAAGRFISASGPSESNYFPIVSADTSGTPLYMLRNSLRQQKWSLYNQQVLLYLLFLLTFALPTALPQPQ